MPQPGSGGGFKLTTHPSRETGRTLPGEAGDVPRAGGAMDPAPQVLVGERQTEEDADPSSASRMNASCQLSIGHVA